MKTWSGTGVVITAFLVATPLLGAPPEGDASPARSVEMDDALGSGPEGDQAQKKRTLKDEKRGSLTTERLAALAYTNATSTLEGVLSRMGDGRLWLEVPLAAGVDRDELVRRRELLPSQIRGAPPGTYLRPFAIAVGGPSEPMLKRRLGQRVKLMMVQDRGGRWAVTDIRSIDMNAGSKVSPLSNSNSNLNPNSDSNAKSKSKSTSTSNSGSSSRTRSPGL